jgi:single stranded DNA-binding protein
MSHDLNRVEVLGHLGQDPEMRLCADGPVTTFSVATNRPTKSDCAPETDWHRVVCFGKRAEFAGRYLKKGHPASLKAGSFTAPGKAATGKSTARLRFRPGS